MILDAEPPSSPKSKFLFLGALIVFLGVGVLYCAMRFSGPETTVRFQVRRGQSAREIARGLQAQGLIHYPWNFLVWSKVYAHKALHPGMYDLSARESGFTFYRKMLQGPPLVRVTFPEGWTSKQMAALLESHGVTSALDFLTIVSREKREGFLFPDTYFFEQGLPADAVLARLVGRFKDKVPKDFKEQTKLLKLSYGQLVTLASIVEREAQAPEERALIAGVFMNRLRKHWRLESCATVEYSLGGWKAHLNYKDLKVASPYNTYLHAGLPPGPICNPGAAALFAAAHPAATDMMFFVADGHGKHTFSRDYDDHLAVQRKK